MTPTSKDRRAVDRRIIDMTESELRAAVREEIAAGLQQRQPDARTSDANRPGAEWLTHDEAMKALGVGRTTLHRWRGDGRLPVSKVGSKLYFRRADIEAMLAESRRTP